MCALDIPDDLWEEMLSIYRSNICILHLDGYNINPINPSSDVAKVLRQLSLRELGIHVVIGEILPRAEFA